MTDELDMLIIAMEEQMKTEDILRLGGELNQDGAISGKDLEDYTNVTLDALSIHLDRERIRHGLWKDYPAKDQCYQIKVKVDRVLRSLEGPDLTEEQRANAVEELYDIINYSNFAVRILEGKVGRAV